MNWVDEPATEQQLTYLSQLGYLLDHPLTRSEAARLIRHLKEHPPGQDLAPNTGVSEATKREAYRLHVAVETARQAVAAASSLGATRAQQDLVSAQAQRRDFWLDTCRDAGQMHVASLEVLDLYRSYGCRYCTPPGQQVQGILDALDSAMPLWDREHPELFYQTLELSFPELVRRP